METNRIKFCCKTELEICEAGKITNTVHWIHPDRVMDPNVFLLILDGAFRVEEDGVEYTLQKNDVFFLKSGLHHTSKYYADDGTGWYYVHFYNNVCAHCDSTRCILSSKNTVNPNMEIMLLPKRLNIPPYDAEKLMLSMQDMTVNYASSSRLVRARLSLELKNIFLSLVELDSAVTGRGNDGIVNRITSLVKSTAFDNISSQEISKKLGLNYAYLSRTFSKATGMTIFQYKNHIKIQKAIDLFKIESMNIAEIAQRVGFENQFYFSRVFKSITGFSPTQYIKNIYVQNPDNIIDKV